MIAPLDKLNEPTPPSNEELAARLEEMADLLEGQEANPYRVRAYRTAADRLRSLGRPVHELVEQEGRAGLMHLPDIGRGLAKTIEELTLAGRSGLLEQLRGSSQAEAVLATVPGVGPELAGRIHAQLGVETLEQLEQAAHDGRLAEVAGMGPRRVRAIRESLAGRLRLRRRPPASSAGNQPDVGELLDVDREYREKAEAGKLPRIAPRRFNPSGEAWLPVLHTQRDRRHYSALFSNTAHAHQKGTTHDWVVIYRDDDDNHGQWTVITAKSGALRGRRVVRGREEECARHYAGTPDHAG
jgi:DNA polymerase (family X)